MNKLTRYGIRYNTKSLPPDLSFCSGCSDWLTLLSPENIFDQKHTSTGYQITKHTRLIRYG